MGPISTVIVCLSDDPKQGQQPYEGDADISNFRDIEGDVDDGILFEDRENDLFNGLKMI